MSSRASEEFDRNKFAELEAIMQGQGVEAKLVTLKQLLHSLAAKSSTGVLTSATSAIITSAVKTAVTQNHQALMAANMLGNIGSRLYGSSGNAAFLQKTDDVRVYIDVDVPLLLQQAVGAAVIKVTNVAGKKSLEFPLGDAEWRECIRYATDLFEVEWWTLFFLSIGAGDFVMRFFVENCGYCVIAFLLWPF